MKWGVYNEYSDHVPIYIQYEIKDSEKIIDSTKITAKCKKKMA